MAKDRLSTVQGVARAGLAFIFAYHGLVPKVLWLSPLEVQLVHLNAIPFPAYLFSPIVGVVELLLAVAILFWQRSLLPVYMAALTLVLLLLDVALVMPTLLVAAFSPVSVNVAGLCLCYIVVLTGRREAVGEVP